MSPIWVVYVTAPAASLLIATVAVLDVLVREIPPTMAKARVGGFIGVLMNTVQHSLFTEPGTVDVQSCGWTWFVGTVVRLTTALYYCEIFAAFLVKVNPGVVAKRLASFTKVFPWFRLVNLVCAVVLRITWFLYPIQALTVAYCAILIVSYVFAFLPMGYFVFCAAVELRTHRLRKVESSGGTPLQVRDMRDLGDCFMLKSWNWIGGVEFCM